MDLPPKRHVWIPEKCEYGLIYEHKLHMCVLPPDDWECMLGLDMHAEYNPNRNEVYQVYTTNVRSTTAEPAIAIVQNKHITNINDDTLDSVEESPIKKDNSAFAENDAEASGDGAILMEVDNLMPVENRQTEIVLPTIETQQKLLSTQTSRIDPKLSQQLQHLSQLIDGLKQTYQQQDNENADLRADQLNAFLTHFNIKNNYDALSNENYRSTPISSTTPLPEPRTNASSLEPETKFLFSNYLPKYQNGFANSPYLYNNAQNSMFYSMPDYTNYATTPKLSEDTINTVLQLSKQMIATQNIPKVIPNPAYYNQPVIQPVIYPSSMQNQFTNFFTNHRKPIMLSHYAPTKYTNTITTPRPIITSTEFSVTPATIANFYTPSPHLNDNTANNVFYNDLRYPTLNYDKPNYVDALFPTQIDPNKIQIHPNSQKFDSIEQNEMEGNLEYAQYNSFMHSTTTVRPSVSLKPQTYTRPPSYEGAHLVNFGGNYIPYEKFTKSVLPLLGKLPNGADLSQLEFITCATGVRQPNTTDCTRYFVCSKNDGKVLSYACPPYTAFNILKRICDAHTYTTCSPDAVASSYVNSDSSPMHADLMEALQQIQRKRQNKPYQYNDQSYETEVEQAPPLFTAFSDATSTTGTPATVKPTKKRKYYCKEGDKVADQLSNINYFVCYKNAQGRMKGHKMTCPTRLIFCAETSICTLSTRCT